jgi:hypothetical protein
VAEARRRIRSVAPAIRSCRDPMRT